MWNKIRKDLEGTDNDILPGPSTSLQPVVESEQYASGSSNWRRISAIPGGGRGSIADVAIRIKYKGGGDLALEGLSQFNNVMSKMSQGSRQLLGLENLTDEPPMDPEDQVIAP